MLSDTCRSDLVPPAGFEPSLPLRRPVEVVIADVVARRDQNSHIRATVQPNVSAAVWCHFPPADPLVTERTGDGASRTGHLRALHGGTRERVGHRRRLLGGEARGEGGLCAGLWPGFGS